MTVRFERSDRRLELDLDIAHPPLAGSDWERAAVTMIPLTEEPVNYGR